MDRELKLSENVQRLKEVQMGDVPLDIKGCFEPQGVVDEANLAAWLTGPAVLRGHTGAVSALAVFPNGDTVIGSWDKTAIIWSPEGEQKRELKGHTGLHWLCCQRVTLVPRTRLLSSGPQRVNERKC